MLVVGHAGARAGVLREPGVGPRGVGRVALHRAVGDDVEIGGVGGVGRPAGRQRAVARERLPGRLGLRGLGGFGGLAQRQRVSGALDGPEVELRRVADVGQHRGGVLHAGDRHGDLVVARRAHLRAGHPEPVDAVVEDIHRFLELGLRDGLRGLVDDGQTPRQVEAELGGPFDREDGGKRTQGDDHDRQHAGKKVPPLPRLGSRRRRAHASSASPSCPSTSTSSWW